VNVGDAIFALSAMLSSINTLIFFTNCVVAIAPLLLSLVAVGAVGPPVNSGDSRGAIVYVAAFFL